MFPNKVIQFFVITLIFFNSSFLVSKVLAFAPEEYLSATQEKRAKKLFLQVKCLVCEGQVIYSSDTQLAYNLRKLIRDQISEGKSDDEIKSYLINQYGSDILNSPPFNPNTYIIWFLPVILLISAMFFWMRFFIKK